MLLLQEVDDDDDANDADFKMGDIAKLSYNQKKSKQGGYRPGGRAGKSHSSANQYVDFFYFS